MIVIVMHALTQTVPLQRDTKWYSCTYSGPSPFLVTSRLQLNASVWSLSSFLVSSCFLLSCTVHVFRLIHHGIDFHYNCLLSCDNGGLQLWRLLLEICKSNSQSHNLTLSLTICSISFDSAKEEKVLIGATIDLLRIMADLKLTEREIALLNAVILFHPGELSAPSHSTTLHRFSHSTSSAQ